VRNQAKWERRKAQKEFEKKLAKESKKNPKAFYKYAHSKLKTRTGIAHLAGEKMVVSLQQTSSRRMY